MPTLNVLRDFLFDLLGKPYTDTQFEDLCFSFGVELDDITSEKEIYMREQGKGSKAGVSAEYLSSDVLYKIDTPANRYDLLCAEGMTTAMKVFLGLMPVPRYTVLNRASPLYHMTVEKSVKHIRDYVVCAVLRDIRFTSHSYNSFIDFQEKLHAGLARRRTLASVGTHDLDKIGTNKFLYAARPKDSITFVPLRQTKVLNCADDGLAAYYADDRKISKYVPLISSLPRYPVIMDADETHILSLPPIINSSFSCISVDTKNIFIECTAPDHYRAQVLVNQIVAAFSMYCAKPFTIEAVKVDYEETTPDGITGTVTPNMDASEVSVDLQRVNRTIGIDLKSSAECAEYLKKMMYHIKSVDQDTVTVEVPVVRSDVLGKPDVIEDVAIAYGYNNIEYTECTTHGAVSQTPLSKVSQLLRSEMANAGYLEMLTYSLCSRDEAFGYLGRVDDNVAAHIANPQTFEFQVCRPSLMPGLLKTLSAHKSHPLPLRLFECSDVVLLDNERNFPPILELPDNGHHRCGARNQRHLAALYCSSDSCSLENIHGLAEFALMKLGIARMGCVPGDHAGDTYSIEKGCDGAFFPGRAMNVYLHRQQQKILIGTLGVIHPTTLKAYEIPFPCSFLELNIQFLCVAV